MRREPGVLEFEASLAGITRGLWVRTAEPLVPRADAVLPATLLPAMTQGGTLRLPGPVSPRLLRGTEEIQAVFSLWARTWPLAGGPMLHVDVAPDEIGEGDVEPGTRVAAFFSGGVDSFATVLARPDVTDLIFVAGLDLPLGDTVRIATVERHLRAAAADLGRRFIRVDTNLRQLTNQAGDWQLFYGSALAMVALCLAGALRRVHIGGFESYANLYPSGSHPLIDHHWAPEGLEIFHDGARFTRAERVVAIADHPVVRRRLRVCWQNRGSELNCGACHKCLMTMVPLAVLGVLEEMETFPPLELERMAALPVPDAVLDPFWHTNMELARERDASPELIRALEAVLATIHRRQDDEARQRRRRAWRR